MCRVEGMVLTGGNRALGGKTYPRAVFPLQISHGLGWDRTQASWVIGRRLTACAVRTLKRTKIEAVE